MKKLYSDSIIDSIINSTILLKFKSFFFFPAQLVSCFPAHNMHLTYHTSSEHFWTQAPQSENFPYCKTPNKKSCGTFFLGMNYSLLPSVSVKLRCEDPYELSGVVYPSNVFINVEAFWQNPVLLPVMRLSRGINKWLQLRILLFPRKWKISLYVLWSNFVKLVDISDSQN